MTTAIAALIGSSVEYVIHLAWVSIKKQDGSMSMMGHEVFDHVYTRLSYTHAALNEDCIEYTEYKDPNKYLIYELYDTDHIVILRNFQDMIKAMKYEDFIKYYETFREEQ